MASMVNMATAYTGPMYVTKEHPTRTFLPVPEGNHLLQLLSPRTTGLAVGIVRSPYEPGDIVRYQLPTGKGLTRLTQVNDDILAGKRLGEVEEISFDPDTLELTLVPSGEWQQVPIFNSVDTDLFGAATGDKRLPGPFADLETGYTKRNIDPRK